MSSTEESAEVELNHCVVGKVFVFPVPKLENAELGYKASAWQKQPIWSGRLRVVTKGKTLTVLLEHTDKEGLFAACPVTSDKTVETVTDSSRYFVLRLTDGQGRHALLGLGFQDRNEAFDFKVSVQDARKQKTEDWTLKNNGPSKDYSIPQGSKIHVNLSEGKKKKHDTSGSSSKKGDASSISAAVAGMKIADGDGEKKGRKGRKKDKNHNEGEANFDSFPSTNAAALAPAAGGAPAKTADVLGFGFDFGAPASSSAKPAAASGSNSPASAWPSSSSASSSSSSAPKAAESTPGDWVTF